MFSIFDISKYFFIFLSESFSESLSFLDFFFIDVDFVGVVATEYFDFFFDSDFFELFLISLTLYFSSRAFLFLL